MATEDNDEVKTNEQGEVIGQGNPRNDLFAELAEQSDEREEAEIGEVSEDTEVVEEAKDVDEVKSETLPVKVKIKVNGKELELTQDELIERAQKSEAAEQRFQEASRLRKEAEEFRKPPEKDASEVVADDLALARAIQMGTEEEAVAAISKIRSRPSFNEADLARMVDNRIEYLSTSKSFAEKNKDIFEVPYLDAAAGLAYRRMKSEGDARPHWVLLQAAADEVRQWYGSVNGGQSLKEKQEKKQSLTLVKTASSVHATKQEEEPDDNPSSVIANMAQKRGQHYGGGNL